MERVLRKISKRRNPISIFVCLVLIGLYISPSHAEGERETRYGFGLMVGTNSRNKRDFALAALFPRMEFPLSKGWDFELEGNFSYYFFNEEKNLIIFRCSEGTRTIRHNCINPSRGKPKGISPTRYKDGGRGPLSPQEDHPPGPKGNPSWK
jgi:hypothetical protein